MRRAAVLVFFAAVAVVVILGATGFSTGPVHRPSLRLVRTHPLTVKGTGFKRAERVRLVAATDGTRQVDRERAGASGSFTATFQVIDYDPCSSVLIVRAVGTSGSQASLKVAQRECPPKL